VGFSLQLVRLLADPCRKYFLQRTIHLRQGFGGQVKDKGTGKKVQRSLKLKVESKKWKVESGKLKS